MMLTAPEFTSPRLTIRARATVTVAGLAKPAKAPDMETCPRQCRGQQRQHGNKVMAQFAPHEEAKDSAQQGEQEGLIEGHGCFIWSKNGFRPLCILRASLIRSYLAMTSGSSAMENEAPGSVASGDPSRFCASRSNR